MESMKKSPEAKVTQSILNLIEVHVHACGPAIDYETKVQEKTTDGQLLYEVFVREDKLKKVAGKEVSTTNFIRLKSIVEVPEGLRLCEVKIFNISTETSKNVDTYYRITKVRS